MALTRKRNYKLKDKTNPIDSMQEIAELRGYSGIRLNSSELSLDIQGQWTLYKIVFMWYEDTKYMLISCPLDMTVGARENHGFYELLTQINCKTTLGHFDYSPSHFSPNFRYNLLIHNHDKLGQDFFEDLLDTILTECDRFYPVLEAFVYTDLSPTASLKHGVLDVVGNA